MDLSISIWLNVWCIDMKSTIALIELIVLYRLYGIKDFDHCS
jgi:hypothetical protein